MVSVDVRRRFFKYCLKVGAAASSAETDGGLPMGSVVLMDYLEDPSRVPLYSYNNTTSAQLPHQMHRGLVGTQPDVSNLPAQDHYRGLSEFY